MRSIEWRCTLITKQQRAAIAAAQTGSAALRVRDILTSHQHNDVIANLSPCFIHGGRRVIDGRQQSALLTHSISLPLSLPCTHHGPLGLHHEKSVYLNRSAKTDVHRGHYTSSRTAGNSMEKIHSDIIIIIIIAASHPSCRGSGMNVTQRISSIQGQRQRQRQAEPERQTDRRTDGRTDAETTCSAAWSPPRHATPHHAQILSDFRSRDTFPVCGAADSY